MSWVELVEVPTSEGPAWVSVGPFVPITITSHPAGAMISLGTEALVQTTLDVKALHKRINEALQKGAMQFAVLHGMPPGVGGRPPLTGTGPDTLEILKKVIAKAKAKGDRPNDALAKLLRDLEKGSSS